MSSTGKDAVNRGERVNIHAPVVREILRNIIISTSVLRTRIWNASRLGEIQAREIR